jgi:hypothetical protein
LRGRNRKKQIEKLKKRMSDCTHPTVWGGLCVECGADVTTTSTKATSSTPQKSSISSTSSTTSSTAGAAASSSSSSSSTPKDSRAAVVPVVGGDGRARFAIMHGDERLVVTAEEAARLHAALCERLLGSRRLVLVLDLDLTLIHATTARELQETTNRLGKVCRVFFFFFF